MRLIFILLALFSLTSCVETAVGTAIYGTGSLIAQERTVGQIVDDTSIFWRIKHAYLNENAQDLLAGVNVEVIESRVHLTGAVDTQETRIEAVKLAWQATGVTEVINEVIVKGRSEKTLKELFASRWIKTQVSGQLLFNKEVKSANYSIEVVEGTVYLMGIAQNTAELDLVTNIASKVKGVNKVISHVRLKGNPDRA